MECNNYVTSIFRAIGYVGAYGDNDSCDKNTTVIDVAEQKEDNKYKTGITRALNDYSEVVESLHGGENSKITSNEVDSWHPFSDNIFYTDEVRTYVHGYGGVYQRSLFEQAITKDDGLSYADYYSCKCYKNVETLNRGSVKKLYKSALQYAKADIKAIQSARNLLDGVNEKVDGKELTVADVESAINTSYFYKAGTTTGSEMLDLSLDSRRGILENTEITAEEYACYLLATDILDGAMDGKITKTGVEVLKQKTTERIRQEAAYYYLEYAV